MQVSEAPETVISVDQEQPNGGSEPDEPAESGLQGGVLALLDQEPIQDVSGSTLELSMLDNAQDSVCSFYMYKNVFNLIPSSIGGFGCLKTFKFFANEINLFPPETANLVDLECLQVKIASPGLSGLPLHKLKSLKELELCKVPERPSAFPLFSEIANLTCLTRLAVSHFSIRVLPPEIGFLVKLEDLDLSFNKLRNLPDEITALSALNSLKIANNKLVELQPDLSLLPRLETLDLSHNRLTSLGSLKLETMQSLQKLNLQYNKLLNCLVPSWICCNFEGNGIEISNVEFVNNVEIINSSDDADLVDAAVEKCDESHSRKSSHGISSLSSDSLTNNRFYEARRMGKGWKRRDLLQQRARQELLNSVRKWRSDDYNHMKVDANCNECKLSVITSESLSESSSLADYESSSVKDLDENDDSTLIGDDIQDEKIVDDPVEPCKECDNNLGGKEHKALSNGSLERTDEKDGNLALDASKSTVKSKRHSDDDLENPKPSKSQRPFGDLSKLSCKYSTESFCNMSDRLLDGFYDAGRDRPFSSLQSYEKNLCLDSREVILVDREMDDELNAITSSAKALVSSLKQPSSLVNNEEHMGDDNLQRASLLSLFVSNWFGGSDRSNIITKKRKSWSGSNYEKPFVCTCATGNDVNRTSSNHFLSSAENVNFVDLCEQSLRTIKQSHNSNIVPIGAIRWGVCRHRAVLMKYLCDRVTPPIPCELVRGYLDFSSHAWNVILVRWESSWVRMVVDACCPTDIREETDPEYFCRYIPSGRIHVSEMDGDIGSPSPSFPSVSLCSEVEKVESSSLKRCKFGSLEAAAKVRTLKANEASVEEMKNFEYNFLGEVRMLGVLKRSSCIVEIIGHQISSKWVPSVDGNAQQRMLESAIVMEYIEGGSLKSYVKKLAKDGKKRLPVDLALFIARDIAFALSELHSKHIIHRDIKSENVLIDLDRKKADGSPVVKLCDFDRAVPLRSLSHTCCIAHLGIPPPDVCVGTPRWMAPEVLQAMHIRNSYGLEIDIWSYGCLLLELLTLEVPYAGLPESEIYDQLQMGQRPRLTDELEALGLPDEPALAKPLSEAVGVDAESEILGFLVDLFRLCTQGNPDNRPAAQHLYDLLHVRTNSLPIRKARKQLKSSPHLNLLKFCSF